MMERAGRHQDIHLPEVGLYLRRMAPEDIGSVATEAFELVMSDLESASWIPGPSAALAVFLASDRARSISGQGFPIEGDSPSSGG